MLDKTSTKLRQNPNTSTNLRRHFDKTSTTLGRNLGETWTQLLRNFDKPDRISTKLRQSHKTKLRVLRRIAEKHPAPGGGNQLQRNLFTPCSSVSRRNCALSASPYPRVPTAVGSARTSSCKRGTTNHATPYSLR